MKVYLSGIGVLGPGLTDWLQAKKILRREIPYINDDIVFSPDGLLSSRERRRVGKTTFLSLAVAKQACDFSGIAPNILPTVFVASAGDLENLHYLCDTLANKNESDRRLSPTKFHNSVHNASAGYWAIATHCQQKMNCVSGGSFSVAVGFVEAVCQVLAEKQSVLLVIYDASALPPLDNAYPVKTSFASAWVLQPELTENSIASITLTVEKIMAISTINISELEKMRLNNPSAQVLPILHALATQSAPVNLPLNTTQHLNLDVSLL